MRSGALRAGLGGGCWARERGTPAGAAAAVQPTALQARAPPCCCPAAARTLSMARPAGRWMTRSDTERRQLVVGPPSQRRLGSPSPPCSRRHQMARSATAAWRVQRVASGLLAAPLAPPTCVETCEPGSARASRGCLDAAPPPPAPPRGTAASWMPTRRNSVVGRTRFDFSNLALNKAQHTMRVGYLARGVLLALSLLCTSAAQQDVGDGDAIVLSNALGVEAHILPTGEPHCPSPPPPPAARRLRLAQPLSLVLPTRLHLQAPACSGCWCRTRGGRWRMWCWAGMTRKRTGSVWGSCVALVGAGGRAARAGTQHPPCRACQPPPAAGCNSW